MATQIAATTETQPIKATVASGGKLAAFIPATLDEAWRLAGALAGSGMTPKSYGSDQNKIMVGMMAGAEVGLAPFTALQSIAVIGNSPSLWGDGALALVQGSGLLEDMEETDDGHTATCRLNRVGRKTPIVRSFSMDDAKKAGLAGKTGPWSQYPARMRQMRARAFALRDGFADVLKGLSIAEEARDYTTFSGGAEVREAKPLTAAMIELQATGQAADTITPDNPTAAEGRGDSNMGESLGADEHNLLGDETPAWRAVVDEYLDRLTKVETLIDVKGAINQFAETKRALPDDVIADIEAAEHNAQMRFVPATGG